MQFRLDQIECKMTSGRWRHAAGQLLFAELQERFSPGLVRQGRTGHSWFSVSTRRSTNTLFLLSFLSSFLWSTPSFLFRPSWKAQPGFYLPHCHTPSAAVSPLVLPRPFPLSTLSTCSPTRICRMARKVAEIRGMTTGWGCAKSLFLPTKHEQTYRNIKWVKLWKLCPDNIYSHTKKSPAQEASTHFYFYTSKQLTFRASFAKQTKRVKTWGAV